MIKLRWFSTEKFLYDHLPNSSKKLYDEFINSFDFDMWVWNPWARNFKKFMHADRSYNAGNGMEELPPYRDHAAASKKKGTSNIMYVFHPYYLDNEMQYKLQDWCEERNMKCLVYPEKYSFYNHNRTKIVFIMSDDIYNSSLPIFNRIFKN